MGRRQRCACALTGGPRAPSRETSGPACDDGRVTEHEMNNDGFESGWRWLTQQVSRSVERLEDVDIQIARAAGFDVGRTTEFLGNAEQWLTDQAESLMT